MRYLGEDETMAGIGYVGDIAQLPTHPVEWSRC